MSDLQVEADILDSQATQLASAHAGVDKQPNDRRISAVLERVALARRKEPRERVIVEDRDRLLRNRWRAHSLHRRPRDLAISDHPFEQLLQRSIALGHGGRG